VDVLLISILKRITPLVIGGSITGIILIYFLGFFISIVLNNIIWLIISTFLYKYYWKMDGLEDILILYIVIFAMIKKEKNKEQPY
jgi:TctA family transporter